MIYAYYFLFIQEKETFHRYYNEGIKIIRKVPIHFRYFTNKNLNQDRSIFGEHV